MRPSWNHLQSTPQCVIERITGLEPTTFCMASRCTTNCTIFATSCHLKKLVFNAGFEPAEPVFQQRTEEIRTWIRIFHPRRGCYDPQRIPIPPIKYKLFQWTFFWNASWIRTNIYPNTRQIGFYPLNYSILMTIEPSYRALYDVVWETCPSKLHHIHRYIDGS